MTHARRTTHRSLTRAAAAMAALALVGVAAGGGCQILGLVADRTAGQIPVEPVYKPDPARPLVVLVENRAMSDGDTSDADRVARMIGERLTEQNVAPIVPAEALIRLRDQDAGAYHHMAVAQIGRAVGAGQVLYVDLSDVDVGSQVGSDVAKGHATASVKFVDATSGLVAFPAEADGYAVSAETPTRRVTGNGVTADTVRAEGLRSLSDRIARLFYKYKPADLDAIGDEDMK